MYYKDVNLYELDSAYIIENYYDVLRDGTVYGSSPAMLKNDFYLNPFVFENEKGFFAESVI